eukprot:TRINITY_DN2368_c0_g1_i1.p1 TRINITY_DN2368_c0_g1~~TRINITY_DN2368_c0_g1_i1.p1  ORF type:complete len:164 (+),score=30.37 TRINITY_DN2368_c0_g1_i1:248-739(+)
MACEAGEMAAARRSMKRRAQQAETSTAGWWEVRAAQVIKRGEENEREEQGSGGGEKRRAVEKTTIMSCKREREKAACTPRPVRLPGYLYPTSMSSPFHPRHTHAHLRPRSSFSFSSHALPLPALLGSPLERFNPQLLLAALQEVLQPRCGAFLFSGRLFLSAL